MDKLLRIVKDNKKLMFVNWIVVIVIVYLFISKILFSTQPTKLQLLFVAGIGVVTYFSLYFSLEFITSNKKMQWLNSIYKEFVNMQIFLDNNNLVVEILDQEEEKFRQYAELRSYKVERILQSGGITRLLVR